MRDDIHLIHAGGAADGFGTSLGACSALIAFSEGGFPELRLLAIGSRDEVLAHPGAAGIHRSRVREEPGAILIPGLVNAHTHLDLTGIGPRPYGEEQTFMQWIQMIRESRPSDPERARAAVNDGIERSLRGGVVTVGDIAGGAGLPALEALLHSPLWGISAIEVFGLGDRQAGAIARLDEIGRRAESLIRSVRGRAGWSWQPHAPYSAGLELYRACAEQCAGRGVPIMTHLSETAPEREFVEHGTGAQVDLLKQLGLFDGSSLREVGRGLTPVQHLRPALRSCRVIAAHLNGVQDEDLRILQATRTTVAYCPRASGYFRQPEVFGPHRYRAMLDAGINVALGTDSVVNLPPEQSDRISTLDDARLLVRRDGLDPTVALGMATWRGGVALGLESDGFSLAGTGLPRRLYGLSLVSVSDAVGGASAARVLNSERTPVLLRPSE